MILECSECCTRYLVPDSAIGPDGRTVRCANCKHSWFQSGAPMLDPSGHASRPAPPRPVLAGIGGEPAAAGPGMMEQSVAETDRAGPGAGADPAGPHDAVRQPEVAPPGTYADYDAFAHQPPFRPRRNPARRWTIAALAAGLAMLAATGAIISSGAPGFASGLFHQTALTPLRLVNRPVDRHDYNGNEIFAISGTVINPTDTHQPVPDIRADLRDAQKRIVFSWMIRPEATTLPPKGRVEFNSAKLDVPVNAKELELSFSGETAR